MEFWTAAGFKYTFSVVSLETLEIKAGIEAGSQVRTRFPSSLKFEEQR